jgi:oligogalacturonide lyase
MAGSVRSLSRRGFLLSGVAASQLRAQEKRGTNFPPEIKHYEDPTTDLDVYRLSDPSHASTLPAYYNRVIARNSSFLLFCCDRNGSPQAFRMELKSGETKELSDAQDLDGSSLTLTPDNRSFCYFAGRSLFISSLGGRARPLYQIPEGWERCPGMNVGPDGTHATFVERQGDGSRLRMVTLGQGVARTVLEMPFPMSHPIARPLRAQILFRQGDDALWLVNADGTQKRQLKLAAGRIGPANWAADGKSLLYLGFPADSTQLTAIRECIPDSNSDTLVAKTSQYATFGFNQPATVFVGACRGAASPTILVMLRSTRRELTLCEHKASQPEMTAPRFAPDTQRLYFQSDRDGKPAIYCLHMERFLDKTEGETGAESAADEHRSNSALSVLICVPLRPKSSSAKPVPSASPDSR